MRKIHLISSVFFFLMLTACSTPAAVSTATIAPITPSATTIPVTATPEIPVAVVINSEGIPDAFYQAELARYQASLSNAAEADAGASAKIVMDELIDQVLLAQGAIQNGFQLDDAALQAKIQTLTDQLGGDAQLQTWMDSHGYDREQFNYAMRLSISSAWMRDQIIQSVPATAEEVHVRQILFSEQANAQSVLQEVRAGADFATLAEQYDPITRGDIGWFPRGYLTQVMVEEAAFALQPGEVSDVISSEVGYHLLQVIERDANHTLSPDAYLSAQKQAVSHWLDEQRESSQIEIRTQ